MKSKILTLLLFSFLFLNICIVLSNTCDAADEDYIISIDDTSWDLIKTENVGSETYGRYNIVIILYNSGNVESDIMSVRIQDELGNHTKEGTIGAGEYETFIWDNHPLVGTGKHELKLDYFPTLVDKRNKYNTGSTTITVGSNNKKKDDNPLPGFELVLLLTVVGLLIIVHKQSNKP